VEYVTSKQYQRTVVGQYNSEQLPYGDGEFDRYVANLSLHIVENPDKMLSEAYRVLKDDGIAAFSVWADRSVNTFFAAHEIVGKEVLPKPEVQTRSHFHLSNKDELKALVKRAGFRRVLCFIEPSYISWTPEQHVEISRHSPESLKLQAKNPELANLYFEKLEEYIRDFITTREEPLCFASNVIIAYK
jgi:ubiquinone/menaquinone biosynthesis C-methylase UbiE